MRTFQLALLPLAAACLLGGTASAQIINGSFEIADPLNPYLAQGWTHPLGGEEYQGNRWPFWIGGIVPTHGDWMFACSGMIEQQGVFLNAGDRLLFDYALYNNAFGTLAAYVEIAGPATAFFVSESIADNWPFGSSRPMASGEIIVPESGFYVLRLHAGYAGGSSGEFAVFYDNLRIVPAPGAAAILLAGGLLPRRRR